MSRKRRRLARVNQFYASLRGFDIWRRVQVPECPDHVLTQVIFNSFGWFGRVGTPGEAAHEGQQVLSIVESQDKGGVHWKTVTAPPIEPQCRFREPEAEDEPWYFDLLLEGRLRVATPQPLPICLDGAWACPPYGFTSPADFRLFLEIVCNPAHPLCADWLR
jgi:hypothetical protein